VLYTVIHSVTPRIDSNNSHNNLPMNAKLGNTVYLATLIGVPFCPALTISFRPDPLLKRYNACEYGASYRSVSPGGRKPILAFYITRLSQHLPQYVLAKFRFHSYIHE
jgi:hypothetical protein